MSGQKQVPAQMRQRLRTFNRRLALAAAGALSSVFALRSLQRHSPGGDRVWTRVNHRGEAVSLLSGPALTLSSALTSAIGAPTGARRDAAILTLVTGAVGVYDDIVGAGPQQGADKGFKGHLRALRQGRITTGLVKIAGVGAAGIWAARSITDHPLDRLIAGGVIAGTANLVNLLDLRPGRALKFAIATGVLTSGGPAGGVVAGPIGAASGLISTDLAEHTMLGDGGANAIGAILGMRLAMQGGPLRRAAVLTVLSVLTLASEKVSFTQVIESTPVLREMDAFGRRR
ncbi:MAG: hypothetical protein ABI137_00715 [Antricoccus sp.]